jgi:hypothetical protein
MLGRAVRPGNLGISTAQAKVGPFGMPSIVDARQLTPKGEHDLRDGVVILRSESGAFVTGGFE